MSRFSLGIVALFVFTWIPVAEAFTISLAPLLTRLAPWGNAYVNQFGLTAPSLQSSNSDDLTVQQRAVDLTVRSFKAKSFALDNLQFKEVDTLDDYKSEILDYVYSKSVDRGFA
ncbi:hypothetical protein ACHAXN_000952 [Cyclotella atomus]|jgi:hypothetical protein